MATIWKSSNSNEKSPNQSSASREANNTISGTALTSWSRQQKLAMIACFTILGLLLAMSACSEQSPKPALVGVSTPEPASEAPAATGMTTTAPSPAAAPAPAKKAHKKRPENVTYTDANSGVSFLYPRKFVLAFGHDAQPEFAGLGAAAMNFVQPGGAAVATVEVPGDSYPGTDFTSAFFNVNINRSISEQECAHFALVDSHNVNGGPVEAGKTKIGSTDMETTSNFAASAMTQTETQYLHAYQNGACYEYIMSLGTAGYGVKDGAKPVNRDDVFARLERIMATVKISPVKHEPLAEPAVASIAGGKE